MIVYVGAGSGPLRDLILAAGHGQMVSRQSSSFRIPKQGRWAFDNGAYIDWSHGTAFDNEQYLSRIRRILDLPEDRRPDWCVCPDMVGTQMSLAYSLEWKSMLAHYAPALKWYLALQDRFHPDDVGHALSMEKFDGLFVGGTTRWKLDTAGAWVEFGHQRGLPVHVARVNGPARLQWAVNIGADSVDGTGWVHAGVKWLPYLQDMPVPEEDLFEGGKEFPPEWIRFGAWLRELHGTPEEWQMRLETQEDPYEWVASIWGLSPEEWIEWFNRSYSTQIRLPDFEDPDEFKAWAADLLAEAERHQGVKPAPPLAERPAFVVNEAGELVALSKALGPHTKVVRDAGGQEQLAVVDSEGAVLRSSPIIRAANRQEALEKARSIHPGPVRFPSFRKLRRR